MPGDRIGMIGILEIYFMEISNFLRYTQTVGQLANVVVVRLTTTEYRKHFYVSVQDVQIAAAIVIMIYPLVGISQIRKLFRDPRGKNYFC